MKKMSFWSRYQSITRKLPTPFRLATNRSVSSIQTNCRKNKSSLMVAMPKKTSRSEIWSRIPILIFMAILGGCSTTSLFTPYPVQIQTIKKLVKNKHYMQARDILSRYSNSADKILYLMERGRVSQIANDRKSSIEDFSQIIEEFDKNEEKPTLNITDSAGETAALLINDNAIPYRGEGYERVFVHHFQAMNYLFSGNFDAALVEVRRANLEQELALERHEQEITNIEHNEKELSALNQRNLHSISSLTTPAEKVKNSFQNAYTFYISGLIYEARGEKNDAYIDYKKALEIFPDNHYLKKDVLRLATQLGLWNDYEQPVKHSISSSRIKSSTIEGEVVVLFEQGFAPVKMAATIPLFINNHTEQLVSFPVYQTRFHSEVPLSVSLKGGEKIGVTQPIVYVESLAAKALEEHLPTMAVRQALRFAAKREISRQALKKFGEHGELAVDIFNFITEQADRRSWLTLPNNAQILRCHLPKGMHKLNLSNGSANDIIEIEVVPGRITLVRVIATEGIFHIDSTIM